jgi:putative chitinase
MAALTDAERADLAQECVRQGVGFRVEPHYLLGVAQLRSGISNDPSGTQFGPFRLERPEWDAHRENNEFDIHFTSEQITGSWRRHCTVFAYMASQAFDAFVAAKQRNPSAKELYLQQWPNTATATFDTDFKGALDVTAGLIEPAANAVLDGPPESTAITTVSDIQEPATGPLKKLDPSVVPPQAGAPGLLTRDMLERHWPQAPDSLRRGMANSSSVLNEVGINTPLRLAHFMAQISHECSRGTTMVEKLSYSAERMVQVFPKRFPPTAGFEHNERAFGNKVYNGRLGNRVGTDDGFNFRGRGCIQITGRDNYTAIGKSCGLPLADNPDLAVDSANVLLIAGTIFVKLGCLPECDRNDVVQVSARVNLGHTTSNPGRINGLADRQTQLAIWRQEFP